VNRVPQGRTIAVALGLGLALCGETQAAFAGDHDGRWALLQVTTTVAEIPIIGKMYATTSALSVHDVESSGDRLSGAGTLCSLQLDSGTSMVETIIPPALRRVLPAPRLDARLGHRNGTTTFFQALPTIVVGARLTKPYEALPTNPKDRRVIDEDEDGAPGVTVRVEGIASGDLHVVQRSWARLDGAFLVDGTFGGIVRHGLSQSILDATSPFLRSSPRSRPLVERSYFRMGRIDRTAGCSDAIRRAKAWKATAP